MGPDPLSDTAGELPVRRQRLSVRALVIHENRVLLARVTSRGEPGRGTWTLPGGGVDHGEHPETSLIREVYEETGLELLVGRLLDVYSRRFTGRGPTGVLEDFHGVHLVYVGTVVDLTVEPHVVEVEGTTDACAWVGTADLDSGALVTSDVVGWAMKLPRALA